MKEQFISQWWILLPVILSGAAGIFLLFSSFAAYVRSEGTFAKEFTKGEKETDMQKAQTHRRLHLFVGITLFLSVVLALVIVWQGETELTLFYFIDNIPIYFHVDALGRLFVTVTSVIWLAVGLYAFRYMEHEGGEKRFFGFFLLVYAVLLSLEFSGNLVTMYFFYELMTLTSMPLVLHNGSREAIMAALKYLFYSMCGAYCALFGIYFLYQYCDTLAFQAGGTLNMTAASQNRGILLIAIFMMLIGFGAKAGMFPLHSWLTAAHPVAPAPASAALSSVIVKGGVFALIRSVYYIVGPEFIRGTWVQNMWTALALITVFMGSMLAYREKVFKKRLAYSTVSQVSYIIFGLSLLAPAAMTGALLHVAFHACIKCALFLTAGIFIFRTGKTHVDEYEGIGKQMKVTLWSYTFASLALIGIPPMSGFISKWYLAQGALDAENAIPGVIGIVVLLLSALLTAGYLLPVTMKGFLPGKGNVVEAKKESVDIMTAALLILALLTVILGIWPTPLIRYADEIAKTCLGM